jgi:hypothetical protein
MLRIKPLIRLMTQEELRYYKQDSASFILVYDYKSYVLNCSSQDYIDAYVEGVALYVLTINSRRKYIALEAYQIGHAEAINSVFLWKEQELSEVLGEKYMALSNADKVQKLIPYLM